MPLIDDISTVPYSTKKGTNTVLNSGTTFVADTINSIKDLLVFCGWNLKSVSPPTATVTYPTGYIGFNGRGSGTVGCGAQVVKIYTPFGTYIFSAYAPGESPSPGNSCTMFELGVDGFASIQNLAAVISGVQDPLGRFLFNATAVRINSVVILLTIQTIQLGPEFNYFQVVGDGRWGIGSGSFIGGGYLMESVGPSDYTVNIVGALGNSETEVIVFVITAGPPMNQGTAQYEIPGIDSQYQIVADPYSFAIFNGIHSFGVFSPNIDTVHEGFTAAYCVCAAPPNNLNNEIAWDGFYIPTMIALDAAPATFGDWTSSPGVMSLRSFPGGQPLYSLDGRPLVTAAYLFSAALIARTPHVIGKLWDCIVITDYLAVGGTWQNGSREYVVIASQDGTGGRSRASLLFCINDNYQPVQPGSGGNNSATGVCSATGNPDDFTITWVSGDKFASDMAGQTITITLAWTYNGWVSAGGGGDADGTKPVIATVASSTVLTVTLDLNSSFVSAPFTIP